MPPRYHAAIRKLVDSVLETPGDADLALRKTIADRAAAESGRPAAADTWADEVAEVSPQIAAWADKVARHAYKTTDEDMVALLEQGWSEDAMFEITLAAALGAAVGRYERLVHVMDAAKRRREAS